MSLSEKEQPPVNYLLLAGHKPHLEEPERGIVGRVRWGSRHTKQNYPEITSSSHFFLEIGTWYAMLQTDSTVLFW